MQANIDQRDTTGYNSSLLSLLAGGILFIGRRMQGSNNPPLKGLFSAVQRGGGGGIGREALSAWENGKRKRGKKLCNTQKKSKIPDRLIKT